MPRETAQEKKDREAVEAALLAEVLGASEASGETSYVDEEAYAARLPVITTAATLLAAGHSEIVGRVFWTSQVNPPTDGGNPGYRWKKRLTKEVSLPEGYIFRSETRKIADENGATSETSAREVGVKISKK